MRILANLLGIFFCPLVVVGVPLLIGIRMAYLIMKEFRIIMRKPRA